MKPGEMYDRARLVVALLEEVVRFAQDQGLPATFTERVERAYREGEPLVAALDRLCALRSVGVAQAPRDEMDDIRKAVKERRPVEWWPIQWHLRHSGYDTCERCMAGEIAYRTQRERVCLECGRRYTLDVKVSEWRRRILEERTVVEKKYRHPRPCQYEGCDRDAYAKGYCLRHYQQYRDDPNNMWPLRRRTRRCAVEGCDRTEMARGLCNKHYRQYQKKPKERR